MKPRERQQSKFVLSPARAAQYYACMATVIALLIVGALLILLETVLPGLIAGIIGVCCIGAGLVMAYLRLDFQTANTVLIATMVWALIGTILYSKYLPDSRVAQVFVSKKGVGDIGTENPSRLNQTGQTLTTLRPSGTAVINGQRVD